MAEDDFPDVGSMNVEETIEALDKAIDEMSERISSGEFDEDEERLRIDRLNALSNAVDSKRRLVEAAPEMTLADMWAEDLRE